MNNDKEDIKILEIQNAQYKILIDRLYDDVNKINDLIRETNKKIENLDDALNKLKLELRNGFLNDRVNDIIDKRVGKTFLKIIVSVVVGVLTGYLIAKGGF